MEIDKLKTSIQIWDKMESASAIYYMYGWGKKKDIEKIEEKHESEEDDYRDDTQGNRNAKYLKKARMHANTPQARLKRERTELKKELRG
jgi:hypothetical protein